MFWAARVLHWRTQQVFHLAWKGWVIFNMYRDGDRLLQLLILNEESLVSRSHQLGLITSLPFVHTARRSYRLSDPVNYLDCSRAQCVSLAEEMSWTLLLRGRRSRNKVCVGEPAEGSFAQIICCLQCEFVGSGLEAAFEAADTYTRALAPGLLEVFCSKASKCQTQLKWHYMHQWWMFWLKWRLRMQRNVIRIVNCRFPWTNGYLNALCSFGICLKVGLTHAFIQIIHACQRCNMSSLC